MENIVKCEIIVHIPLSSADFTICTPGIGALVSYSLASSGENSAFVNFALAIANHYKLAVSFHQVQSLPGGQKRYDMRGFPSASTHGQ